MDIGKLLEKASDQVSVRRAFGPAYEKDGLLIIPVALVAGGGGGGLARPGRANRAVRADGPPEGAGPPVDAAAQDMDAGGGFGGLVLPVGVYVVKGDEVRWVSAVDVTIAMLASLGLVRILTRSWARRPRRSGQPRLPGPVPAPSRTCPAGAAPPRLVARLSRQRDGGGDCPPQQGEQHRAGPDLPRGTFTITGRCGRQSVPAAGRRGRSGERIPRSCGLAPRAAQGSYRPA